MKEKVWKTSWTIDEALTFVRWLERCLAPKYHVAMAGGVLHTGSSEHDLDLMIYPHRTNDCSLSDVRQKLRDFGFQRLVTAFDVWSDWEEKHGSLDRKVMEIWHLDGKRVDVHFLYMDIWS